MPGIGLGVGIGRHRFYGDFSGAYSGRVVADGGVVESISCVASASSLLQSASLLLIPSGFKEGKLYAENPVNGNGDLTWTRASDAWRTNASGLVQRTPWNLLQYSEQFNNAFHFPLNLNAFGSGSVANTTATLDPNGTNFADYIQENSTASAQHSIIDIFSGNVSGTTYTWSVFAKVAERTIIQLANNAGGGGQANFNLSTGVATLNNGVSASMQNVGNGWWRCVLTYTSSTTGNHNLQIRLCDALGNATYTGNGTSGIFIWGAQLVEGSSAQTYFPTTDRLNVPRLSYMYGSCPSVLLEPQRTNLLLSSNAFSTADWTATNITISDNSQLGIDGNTTASLVTTSNVGNLLYQLITVVPLTVYTFSFYVKRGTMTDMKYRVRDFTNSVNIIPLTSYYSQTNSSTFTRISVTITAPSGCTSILFYPLSDTGSIGTAILTRAQVEVGSYPTTYIQTTSASATRVADSFTRNNIYTNGLISASGGTWFVELRGNVGYPRISAYPYLFLGTSANGSTGNVIGVGAAASGRPFLYYVQNGTFNIISATASDSIKIAFSWTTSVLKVFVNGSLTNTYTGLTWDITTFQNILGIGEIPMFLQQMALYSTTLSDTQCQTLTTL